MRINLDEVTFIKQPSNAVIARYRDHVVCIAHYQSYQLNRQEAINELNKQVNPDMKTLTKDNFLEAMQAYADTQGQYAEEYFCTPSELAKEFLEGFYEHYFEIDKAKEARRAEYLKLKEEFGNE